MPSPFKQNRPLPVIRLYDSNSEREWAAHFVTLFLVLVLR
jgi:hypothetical protein